MIVSKFLLTVGASLFVQAGAGCFSPTIIEDDGEVVILRYGPWATASEVASKAERMCAEHDRDAELVADLRSAGGTQFSGGDLRLHSHRFRFDVIAARRAPGAPSRRCRRARSAAVRRLAGAGGRGDGLRRDEPDRCARRGYRRLCRRRSRSPGPRSTRRPRRWRARSKRARPLRCSFPPAPPGLRISKTGRCSSPGSRAEPFGNRLVLAGAAGAAFDSPLDGAGSFAAALGGGRLALADPRSCARGHLCETGAARARPVVRRGCARRARRRRPRRPGAGRARRGAPRRRLPHRPFRMPRVPRNRGLPRRQPRPPSPTPWPWSPRTGATPPPRFTPSCWGSAPRPSSVRSGSS